MLGFFCFFLSYFYDIILVMYISVHTVICI